MEFYTYKGISAGKYIEGEIEALNQEEASHKLKNDKEYQFFIWEKKDQTCRCCNFF